jgi:(p)ppGpp synthase/HD superfamily hydrolase
MAADWRVVTLVLAHHASELRAAAEELAAETVSETTEMATSAHWRNWDQEAPPPPSRAAASSSSAETRSTSSTGTSRDGNDLSRRAFVLAREALDVYAPLAHRLGMHQLKVELEDLGFAVLYPQERALVMAAIEERGAKHELVLADTLAVLKRTLQDDTHFMGSVAHVSFAARAKPPYSVWRKLVKLSRDAQLRGETGPEAAAALTARLDQVLDHLALRVVCDVTAPSAPEGSSSTAAAADSDLETSAEKAAQDAKDAKGFALCYHVLGLVHAQWGKNNKDPVSDYKVKDYVSAPKANGYQSLHTTCTCRLHGQAWPFEVQVRTQAMHRVAEWGKAAHVAYKQHDAWTSAYSSQAPDIQGQNPAQDRRSTRSSSGSSRSSGRSSKLGSASHTHKSTKSSKAAPAMGVGRSTKRPWPRSKSHNSPTKSAPPLPDSINDSKSYATWLHGDLRARRVFVFVKGGAQGASILDLEQGCSIVDALRRTNHPSQALRKVRVNGGRVPASYTLRNGDAIVFNGAAASAASTSAASSRKREERMSTL